MYSSLSHLRVKRYSSKKILTMEFVHGIKINDVAKLQKNNFDLKEVYRTSCSFCLFWKVSDIFIRCFSTQIYVHGWIHSDPHPGNLLVRNKGNKTQLVVLDHGLYERYSSCFRETHFAAFQRSTEYGIANCGGP